MNLAESYAHSYGTLRAVAEFVAEELQKGRMSKKEAARKLQAELQRIEADRKAERPAILAR